MQTPDVPHFHDMQQAHDYVDLAREHYRNEHAAYKGTRNEEQQLIAELTSEEAHLLVDATALGVISVLHQGTVEPPKDYDHEVTKGDFNWENFKDEFSRLLVGFAILTHRLERDGFGVPSYADMPADDRKKAASALFGDFLQHNAYRFGVDTAGLKTTTRKSKHTEDGGIEVVRTVIDKDEARNDREIVQNMLSRGYSTGVAAHAAGKISPAEYVRLRREFPEMNKDNFDRDVSFYSNARKQFESQEKL